MYNVNDVGENFNNWQI